MKEKNQGKRAGFTLIELLISLLLFSIVGLILTRYLLTGTTLYKKVYSTYEASTEARIGLSYMAIRIRETDARNGIDIKDDQLIFKDEKGNITSKIYHKEGQLLEEKTGEAPKAVAELAEFTPAFESFEVLKNGNKMTKKRLVLTVAYEDAEHQTIRLENKISMRSN